MPIGAASASVRATYHQEGSFLRGDIVSAPTAISVELDVSSEAPIADVQALLRIAHRSCFVENALRSPIQLTLSDRVNGQVVT